MRGCEAAESAYSHVAQCSQNGTHEFQSCNISVLWALPRARIQRRSRFSAAFRAEDAGSPERRSRMLLRSILKISLCATILVMIVTTASAVAPADQTTSNSVQAIHTYLLPDLSLKSALLVPLSPQPPTGFHKTCRCSCGTAKCATDADCGGGEGSCSAFISCCAKPEAASIQGAQESSRTTALPAFKEQCN